MNQNTLLIDIRSEIAYLHGHMEDAVSMPEPIDSDKLCQLMAEQNKKEVMIYCSIGERSKDVVRLLREQGIVADHLDGGYQKWLIDHVSILSKEEKQQFSRQMILPELGESGQEALKRGKVLVIGAGALGCAALTYLVSAGIGTVGIVDGDTIDRSNLHRQTLFTAKQIGEKKVEAARVRLSEMNPFVQILTYDHYVDSDNIAELIQAYDFIVDGTDRVETKFLINDACVLGEKAFCHAGNLAYEGQVMTWMPGEYPCYRCIFEDVPMEHVPTCAEAGIIGALAGIIGSMQAMEAIKYITGIGKLLTGQIYHLDIFQMKTRIIPIHKKNPDCKVCGESKGRTIEYDYFTTKVCDCHC